MIVRSIASAVMVTITCFVSVVEAISESPISCSLLIQRSSAFEKVIENASNWPHLTSSQQWRSAFKWRVFSHLEKFKAWSRRDQSGRHLIHILEFNVRAWSNFLSRLESELVPQFSWHDLYYARALAPLSPKAYSSIRPMVRQFLKNNYRFMAKTSLLMSEEHPKKTYLRRYYQMLVPLVIPPSEYFGLEPEKMIDPYEAYKGYYMAVQEQLGLAKQEKIAFSEMREAILEIGDYLSRHHAGEELIAELFGSFPLGRANRSTSDLDLLVHFIRGQKDSSSRSWVTYRVNQLRHHIANTITSQLFTSTSDPKSLVSLFWQRPDALGVLSPISIVFEPPRTFIGLNAIPWSNDLETTVKFDITNALIEDHMLSSEP